MNSLLRSGTRSSGLHDSKLGLSSSNQTLYRPPPAILARHRLLLLRPERWNRLAVSPRPERRSACRSKDWPQSRGPDRRLGTEMDQTPLVPALIQRHQTPTWFCGTSPYVSAARRVKNTPNRNFGESVVRSFTSRSFYFCSFLRLCASRRSGSNSQPRLHDHHQTTQGLSIIPKVIVSTVWRRLESRTCSPIPVGPLLSLVLRQDDDLDVDVVGHQSRVRRGEGWSGLVSDQILRYFRHGDCSWQAISAPLDLPSGWIHLIESGVVQPSFH